MCQGHILISYSSRGRASHSPNCPRSWNNKNTGSGSPYSQLRILKHAAQRAPHIATASLCYFNTFILILPKAEVKSAVMWIPHVTVPAHLPVTTLWVMEAASMTASGPSQTRGIRDALPVCLRRHYPGHRPSWFPTLKVQANQPL